MPDKDVSENKPITENNNKPNQEPIDNERRSVIKKAVCTIGAAYIAPVTLNLLLTEKANAASGPPPPPFG